MTRPDRNLPNAVQRKVMGRIKTGRSALLRAVCCVLVGTGSERLTRIPRRGWRHVVQQLGKRVGDQHTEAFGEAALQLSLERVVSRRTEGRVPGGDPRELWVRP